MAKKKDGPKEIDFHSAEARKARAKGELPENTKIRSPYARKDGGSATGHGVVLHEIAIDEEADADGPRQGER